MTRQNPFNKIYRSEKFAKKDNPMPMMVDLEMTNHCNLRCKFCNRYLKMKRLRGYMSDSTFCKVADECAEHNIAMRFIGWGEPLMHPKIIDFMEYAKPLPLHITTNGQLITERQMRDLVRIELDSIIFSMQGANKKGYEEMRVGASYDKLVDNIMKLIKIRGDKEKPYIHVSSTMTNESKDEIGSFVNYWNGIVDSVGFGKTDMHEERDFVNYRPCMEVYQKLTIKWDGQVSCCCNDYDNLLVVGNMKDYTLEEIWHGEQLKSVRTLLDNGRFRNLTLCKDCYPSYDF